APRHRLASGPEPQETTAMTPTPSVAMFSDLPSKLAVRPTQVARRLLARRDPPPVGVVAAIRRLYAGEGTEGDARVMLEWGLRLFSHDDARVREVADALAAMPASERDGWLDDAAIAWAPFMAKMGRALGRLPDVAAVADEVRIRGCVVEPGCALDLDSHDEVIVVHSVVQAPEEDLLAGFTLPAGAVPAPRSDEAATATRAERLADAVLKEVQ
ncbi:MAG: hypothetical protein ACRELB_06320, partial [Polyangiaceae bacterium]